jgi:P27 family predicted phage terminase small subunit
MNVHVRWLKGGGGPRPSPPGAGAPAGPVAPPWELDGDALEEWNRLGPLIAADGRLDAATAAAFGLYCRAYALNRKAYDEARGGAAAVVTDSGAEKSNPAVAVFLRTSDLMLKILGSFSLTPLARPKVGAAERAPDALDEFLAQHRPR